MYFSSMTFLCVFLPVVFILYYILPSLHIKNALLILASLLFYAYGEPIYVFLMLFSILMNYLLGILLGSKNRIFRNLIMIVAIILNLGMLLVFKYADMGIETINDLFNLNIPLLELALPIGISFFTFQALSYVIDVYRNKSEPERNLFNVMLYVSFFPQLIAGPIVKWNDIKHQLNNRKTSTKVIAEGVRRFSIGLAKKVLISNTMAVAADSLFSASNSEINIISAWIAAISYTLQIYFDFSGYSDMAIGLGHMFGFEFKENFNYPYIADSIKDFWRRWHISLSTWFKEYLYIPLGGNRKGKVRTCINKIIVFFTTGLWHGASWTFVIWGLWHGLFMLLEEFINVKRMPKIIRHFYTLLVVCIGFVMFRADTFQKGIHMIYTMFIGWDFNDSQYLILLEQLTPLYLGTLLIAIIASFPICKRKKALGRVKTVLSYIYSLVLLVLCMLSLSGGAYNPFIYFRF